MSLFRDLPCISLLTYLYVTLSALLRSSPSLAVQGAAALVLVAAEWEGGFALRLGHFAGQMDKGFDECSSVGHRDLPQPDLLLPCPLLSRLAVHSPLILQVQLITHNNNSHLWDRERISSIITPVFSVTWSFRNHSDMLICCSRNIVLLNIFTLS